MLESKLQLNFAHLARDLLVDAVLLEFDLPHEFTGVEDDAGVQTNLLDLFLKRANGTLDGGQVEQLLIVQHRLLRTVLARKVRLANLYLFELLDLFAESFQLLTHVALRFAVDELQIDDHYGRYFLD